MKLLKNDISSVSIRKIQDKAELEKAQSLRYKVFFEEFGATPPPEIKGKLLDIDEYDDYADHLVVIVTDPKTQDETIIGTYRLLRRDQAEIQGQFNSSKWYNLDKLLSTDQSVLELSRSCVLPEYRTRPVLQLLWQGIADYITENNIEMMFGCASFHTTNVDEIAIPLSYLYHHHLSPNAVRARALDKHYVNMNLTAAHEINTRRVFHDLPPLMKGYLRVGSSVGDGAVIDHQFGTTDVFVVMQTHMLTDRYRKHYERKVDKEIPGGGSARKAVDILAEDI